MADRKDNEAMKAAFEAKYQRDWNDPAGDDMTVIWTAAWNAAQPPNSLVQLAERIAGLNAAAGEIGAGMLAQLVQQANIALAELGPRASNDEHR